MSSCLIALALGCSDRPTLTAPDPGPQRDAASGDAAILLLQQDPWTAGLIHSIEDDGLRTGLLGEPVEFRRLIELDPVSDSPDDDILLDVLRLTLIAADEDLAGGTRGDLR